MPTYAYVNQKKSFLNGYTTLNLACLLFLSLLVFNSFNIHKNAANSCYIPTTLRTALVEDLPQRHVWLFA